MKSRSTSWAILSVIGVVAGLVSAAQPEQVFPGKHWERKAPVEAGLDAAKLEAFAHFIGEEPVTYGEKVDISRGCVVKDGYMVYTWGDQAQRGGWFSASKPVLSTLLFFAIQEGKLRSVDDRVADWGWKLSEKDRTMTFRHLADMTSGYACNEAPGQAWAYNDFGILLYAMTLERVWGCSIKEAARRCFAPLQLEDGDLIGDHLKGRGVSTTPRDFARVGWFWLNKGNWGGKQLLPQAYFDAYMHPDVPRGLPRTQTPQANDYLGIGSYGGGHDQVRVGPGLYGFNWWFNGPVSDDGTRMLPDAPGDVVIATGYGGNMMVMLPSQRMVAAGRARWGGVGRSGRLNTAIRMLLEAAKSPVTQPATQPTSRPE